MLTDYDMRRIEMLLEEVFDRHSGKPVPSRPPRLLTSSQAAERLGLSRGYVCDMAEKLGGKRKGDSKKGHWVFQEDILIEKYMALK